MLILWPKIEVIDEQGTDLELPMPPLGKIGSGQRIARIDTQNCQV